VHPVIFIHIHNPPLCCVASGKSTLGVALESALLQLGKRAFRLDGDNIRFGLNKDLGFSQQDRVENIRRIGEVRCRLACVFSWLMYSLAAEQVSKLFASSSTVAITAFISPYIADRDVARKLHEEAGLAFVEVSAKQRHQPMFTV